MTTKATKWIAFVILALFLMVVLLPGVLDDFGRWHPMSKLYPKEPNRDH
jgi:hypothetical protein